MLSKALALLKDEELAVILNGIADALAETLAMPRAAEALEEAAKRLNNDRM